MMTILVPSCHLFRSAPLEIPRSYTEYESLSYFSKVIVKVSLVLDILVRLLSM